MLFADQRILLSQYLAVVRNVRFEKKQLQRNSSASELIKTNIILPVQSSSTKTLNFNFNKFCVIFSPNQSF